MAVHQLHPGAKWQFRIRGYVGAFVLLMFLGWFIFPTLSIFGKVFLGASVGTLLGLSLFGILIYIILIVVIAEIYARMAYKRWKYEFTDTNLKLERGIIWKRYSNIPYERVQNVDITRGILARMLGFSSINIQTAGYSYTPKGGAASEGYIPAVYPEEAEKIRDFLMKRISKRRQGGL